MLSCLRLRPPFDQLEATAPHRPEWLLVDLDGEQTPEGTADLLGRLRSRGVGRIVLRTGASGPERQALGTALAGGPDAVWLAGAEGARAVGALATELAVAEAEHDRPSGAIGIVASIETARGALALRELLDASPRLLALSWHAGLLRRELGLSPDGPLPEPLRHLRAELILAASAARVPALDTPHGGSGRPGLAEAAELARRDGFAGKVARTPDELAIITRAFAQRQ